MRTIMMVGGEVFAPAELLSASDWAAQGYEVITGAFSGNRALREIEEKKPDIVFADIESSPVNGLKLIESCAGKSHAPAFVALSASGSLGPIHRALKLGAVDYLMETGLTKPQLLRCLERVESFCVEEQGEVPLGDFISQSRDDMLRAYFQNLISGGFINQRVESELASQLNIRRDFGCCTVLAVRFRHPANARRELAEKSRWVLSEILRNSGMNYCLLNWMGEKQLVILGHSCRYTADSLRPLAQEMFFALKNRLAASCVLGVGRPTTLDLGLAGPLQQALCAADYYYYDSASPIILYTDRCRTPGDGYSSLEEYREDLLSAFQSMDSGEMCCVFNSIMENLRCVKPGKMQTVSLCVGLYCSVLSLAGDREILKGDLFPEGIDVVDQLNHMERLADYISWLAELRDCVCTVFDRKKDSRSARQVALVKDYIRDHYREKLTLAGVAQVMNLSKGYLSSVFKKETGMHFSDYISLIKVEKAKELIAEHKYLMYEISEQLGFENPYYFSKVFKKLTGHSPREYNLQCLSDDIGTEPIRLEELKKAAVVAG